jgi:hypothetical protein
LKLQPLDLGQRGKRRASTTGRLTAKPN